MKYLARVEIVALAVFGIIGMAFGLVAGRAALKLGRDRDVLDAVMAADTGNTRPRFMRRCRVGVGQRFMFLVIEQNQPAPAFGIERDCDSLRLGLSQLDRPR